MLAAVAAAFLNRMIHFFTNLFFCQIMARDGVCPAGHRLGAAIVLVPVMGGLIVRLMARFGSEQIRGHLISGAATFGTPVAAVLFAIEPWPFARPESTAGSLGSLSPAPGLARPLASAHTATGGSTGSRPSA